MNEDPFTDVPSPEESRHFPSADEWKADPPVGVDSDGILDLPSPEELLIVHDGLINGLRADVNGLADVVAELIQQPPKSAPAPWNWKELDGPASAELMQGLRDWVDWFNDRYGVTETSRIPGCWYRHGPVVEELTAVWTSWRAAYYAHKSPADAPAYWHERILWPTLSRIKSAAWGMAGCAAGHKAPRASQRQSTDHGFEDFLSQLGGGPTVEQEQAPK